MLDLSGRVAIITGAASGIGAATALAFADAGASLVLADYAPDGHDIAGVIETAAAKGVTAISQAVDVRRSEDVDALVSTALHRFGRLDIVLANAAIARKVAAAQLDDAAWSDLIDVDLTGVWRLFRAALGPMRAAGHGRLLATSSTVGNQESWTEHVHYSAAKAGVVGLVRSLAAEVGPDGITVNAIAPGIIETPQTLDAANSLGALGIGATAESQPIRRVGRPDDIANGFRYLASDEASFVTGQLLVIDGGRTLVR
ncbi:SDR family NAD(P)-dependent oxidoreductase [Microbacterium sp. 18062]|uniref:SDR family NAD(P)-dependent oxidoreductase n=1 Tax=Microbacterium sp. 18062 TaxID=2681410 RepID=UPI001357C5D5|nr:SDR family oxidoreductase [Microbacterium sp. 18062]